MYLKKNRVKLEIALAKGRKVHDKRDEIRRKDLEKEYSRDIKNSFRVR